MSTESGKIRSIFCFENSRTVSNDWVVQYAHRYFQLLRQKRLNVRSGCKETVAHWLDGSIHIRYEEHEVSYEEITEQVLDLASNELRRAASADP